MSQKNPYLPETIPQHDSPLLNAIELAMYKTNKGDYVEAIEECRNALQIDPDAAEPYFVMGVIAMLCNDEGQALQMLETAHRIDPDIREYAEGLGTIYTRVGQLADGLYYSKVAMALPQHRLLSQRMPSMLRDLAAAYRNVKPSTHIIEGERLLNIGEYELARRECEAEIRLNPRSKRAYLLLGRAAHGIEAYERAVGAYQAAINLDPADGQAPARLARTLVCLGRLDEAEETARHALRLAPEDPAVFGAAMDALLRCPHVPLDDARALADEHGARITASMADDLAPPLEAGEGPLRIGLMSNVMFNTPAAKPVLDLFRGDNTKGLKYRGYALSMVKDSTTTNIRNRCEEWREVYDLDPFTFALTIRSEGVDVFVDASEPERDTRLEVAASGPALASVGVQVLPDPGMAPGITHVLSDETLASVDRRALRDGQEIIEVPGSLFACDPFDEIPQDLPAPQSLTGNVTFGGMLDLSRLTPACVGLWSEILLACPGSNLLLCAAPTPSQLAQARAIEMFSHHGVADRILFPVLDGDEDDEPRSFGQRLPIAQLEAIDVFLDTLPFSGGQELAEALWVGIPVVTLMGDRRAGAVGASILSAARRVNWIANDREGYLHIARSLAENADELARARSALQSQVAETLLFDTKALATNLAAALTKVGNAARDAAQKTEQ